MLGLATCLAALSVVPTAASADVRYSAPGATGADPCASPATACSLFTAASVTAPGTTIANGDEVIIAPGNYPSTDLGPNGTVQLPLGVNVHGEAGQPRPVITNAQQ